MQRNIFFSIVCTNAAPHCDTTRDTVKRPCLCVQFLQNSCDYFMSSENIGYLGSGKRKKKKLKNTPKNYCSKRKEKMLVFFFFQIIQTMQIVILSTKQKASLSRPQYPDINFTAISGYVYILLCIVSIPIKEKNKKIHRCESARFSVRSTRSYASDKGSSEYISENGEGGAFEKGDW